MADIVVRRDDFEMATAALLDRTFDFVLSALRDAGLQAGDITKVLMVGGSTRMPAVQKALKDCFGEDRVIFNNPDEAVALGAAFICSLNWSGDFEKQITNGSKSVRTVTDGENPVTIEVVDTITGEVDKEATETLNDKIGKGEVAVQTATDDSGNDVVIGIVSVAPAFKFTDGVPRTIGLIVMDKDHRMIADNVLIKGETAPKTSERDYYTSDDGQIHIVIPVVESLSKADSFEVQVSGNTLSTLTVTVDDPALDLHQCDNALTLNFSRPMPKNSQLHVIFTISDNGEMEVAVEDTVSHESNRINFQYSKLY